jgi:5-methylcytosine-specific restriction endonuclease McrA
METIKTCIVCGTEFYAKHLRQIICNNQECSKKRKSEQRAILKKTDKYKAKAREYYHNNTERYKENRIKYLQKEGVKEKLKENAHNYHQRPDIKERAKIRQNEIRQTEKGYIEALYYRLNERGNGYITYEDTFNLYMSSNICFYCGKETKPFTEDKQIDHKTPTARGGTNNINNLVICCKSCNSRKKDMTDSEYFIFMRGKNENYKNNIN